MATAEDLKRILQAMEENNRKLSEALVAVPSGSPLLEQLRRVTPQDVQLQEISVQGDQINLSGRVSFQGVPGPLERINALALNLGNLPISLSDGVKVVKVSRDEDQSSVSFSLEWALDPQARSSIQQLQQLGANGMVQRYRLLERQGVAP